MSGALVGTCKACGQEMIQTEDDCWHPWNIETACPPEHHDQGFAVPEWGRFGRPGREYFIPDEVQPTE